MVIEAPLQGGVALFRVRQGHPPELLFLGIVVEIHMLAAQHVPVEAAILNLVLAEGAELGGCDSGNGR